MRAGSASTQRKAAISTRRKTHPHLLSGADEAVALHRQSVEPDGSRLDPYSRELRQEEGERSALVCPYAAICAAVVVIAAERATHLQVLRELDGPVSAAARMVQPASVQSPAPSTQRSGTGGSYRTHTCLP